MNRYERLIKNKTGRRPLVCNVNKKLDKRLNIGAAYRATIIPIDGIMYMQGKGTTRRAALIDLAQQIEKMSRKKFNCPEEMRSTKQRKSRQYVYRGAGYKLKLV